MASIKETVSNYQQLLFKRGVEGLRSELDSNLQAWQNTKINIAVVGNSGSGKSTFINAILDLDPEDEKSAATGVVETTSDVHQYSNENKNVIFWDLPGVGTTKYPQAKYAEQMNLKQFDYFILIARNRFTENDIWLAKQIKSYGKKFCFVRTHVEDDICNDREDKPKSHDTVKCIEGIRSGCVKTLESIGDVDIYLIDSHETNRYDFGKLIQKLIKDSETVKAYILGASLASATQAIIDHKRDLLLQRIFQVSLVCCLTYQKENAEELVRRTLKAESKLFRQVLNIDDETLRKDRELFSLSEMASDFKIQELEEMSKHMGEVSEKSVQLHREIFEEFNTSFSRIIESLEKGFFASLIANLLKAMLIRLHHFASHIFENIPIEFAQKCMVTEDE